MQCSIDPSLSACSTRRSTQDLLACTSTKVLYSGANSGSEVRQYTRERGPTVLHNTIMTALHAAQSGSIAPNVTTYLLAAVLATWAKCLLIGSLHAAMAIGFCSWCFAPPVVSCWIELREKLESVSFYVWKMSMIRAAKVSRVKRSPVWAYFDNIGRTPRCKLCSREFVRQSGTTNLFARLSFAHMEQHSAAVRWKATSFSREQSDRCSNVC